jgi:hypothetical protein
MGGDAEQRMIQAFLGKFRKAILRRKSIPHPDYLFKTPMHWRLRAEKMRTLAEEADDPTVRALMLRIATDYERLAESANDLAAGRGVARMHGPRLAQGRRRTYMRDLMRKRRAAAKTEAC